MTGPVRPTGRDVRPRPRVFIGFTEVAGYYRQLAGGLEEIGVSVRRIDLSGNPARFGRGGVVAALKRPVTTLSTYRGAAPGSPRRRILGAALATHRVLKALSRVAIFPWAVVCHDVFIFHGLDSFFGYRDLPLLKLLGKKVIYVFNGSDHRPPYLNGKWVRVLDQRPPDWLSEETKAFVARVVRIEAHADAIVALGASAQLHRRPFVNYLATGVPFAPPDHLRGAEPPRVEPDNESTIRILHCPTDPVSKGTAEVRRVIEAIQRKGFTVEYQEITGRPNAEVLEAIQRCDFVVDEVWSDTPMAGLAAEAAYFGKPTVVSGYYASEVDRDLSPDLVPPTIFCLPNDLEAAVTRMASDADYRRDLGARAQTFVRDRWRPAAVAERFLRVINGDVPAAWLYDPRQLRYAHGWGLPEELLAVGVQAVVDRTGVAGLGLSHAADLERLVLQLGGRTDLLVDSPDGHSTGPQR